MPLLETRAEKLNLINQMQGLSMAELSVAYWGQSYPFSLTSGCPKDSNPNLVRRAHSLLTQLKSNETILDIGSGRQHFVILLHGNPSLPPPSNPIISLDITPIDSIHLSRRSNVSHIRADASKLPVRTESIGLIASNMSGDYIEDQESFDQEIFRALKPGRFAILTLMRPNMFTSDPDQYIDRLKTVRELQDYLLTKKLLHNQVLTNSESQIRQRFMKQGFEITDLITRVQDGLDPVQHPLAPSWWEVELKKPK